MFELQSFVTRLESLLRGEEPKFTDVFIVGSYS